MEDLLRIEWTQALNSFVRSCIGILGGDCGICYRLANQRIITARIAVSE